MKEEITKTIKRGTVIKALRTEHLISGQWFNDGFSESTMECPVCAVGAVLREASFVSTSKIESPTEMSACVYRSIASYPRNVENFSSDATVKDINLMLKRGQYLLALSGRYESWFDGKIMTTKRRERLVEWVKKNFPKEIEVTLYV